MKIFTRFAKAALALVLGCAPLAGNAELLLTENFEYNAGDLYGQGEWNKLDTKTDNPIQVVSTPLTYPGHQDATVGKAVLLDGGTSSSCQKLKKGFSDTPITSGTLYYSALVKPMEVTYTGTGTGKYLLMGFSGENWRGFDDGNGTAYCMLSIAPGSADGKFKFGIATQTSTPTFTGEYDLNETYLVAAKYDFSTKTFALWVNPTDAETEPTTIPIDKSSGEASKATITYGLQGVCLYQNPSSLTSGKVLVDAVRVGTSLADVLGAGEQGGGSQGGDEGDEKAEASASPASIDFGTAYQGSTSDAKSIMINAKNLKEGLTLSCSNSAFKVTPASISAEDAMAGTTVSVTFKPTAGQEYAGTLKVMSGSDELASVSLKGTGVAVETAMNYAMLSNMLFEGTAKEWSVYSLESRFGVVTHVDKAGNRFFIQDMTGALEVCTDFMDAMPAIEEGSKISQFYAMPGDGKLYMAMPVEAANITMGTPKSATPYTLADIMQDPESYWNKLVTIEDAEFAKAGETFAASSTTATAEGKNFNVRPFAGTDLIGTEIPAKGSVSGILVAKTGTVIWPRKASDIEAAAADEPEISVTVTTDLKEPAPINVDTKLATISIEAKNLPSAAQLWLGGTNRNLFSLSREEIPAGTGTYEVEVTYHPTAIGSHKATINIDATPTYISSTYAISAKAYDPENLPTITVPESVEQFSAAVGQTDTKQFAISSANMIEYGTVAFESQSTPGTFIINNSSLYPNIPNNFTVTFTPKAAGTYTATIKVEGLKAETRYIQLSGVATGEAPAEEKEGTELRLDASNPLKLMTEAFDGAVKNKPLALEGWDNVAKTGTRAWWGYVFSDDQNGAAKVTAYDSQATDDSPAEMLLVTPALDFKNAEEKLLTFRVMGQYLPEGAQTSDLDVLYIEDADFMQSLGEIGIPCCSDQNDEWMEFVLDLADMDLADTFFIGFRYKGERGRNYSTVYYIDDVTWGRTDIPHIRVHDSAAQNAAMYGMAMTGNLGATTVSDPLTVTAQNLTTDIKIGISGSHPSKFSTSAETLPAQGGTFAVHFTPEEAGVHQVYIDLTADGAATISVPVEALGIDPSGISDVEADGGNADAYNLQGVRVGMKDARTGVYIIGGKKVYIKR
ncbi:MAG: choice-of-anchor D domain-containing protein [Clostridium sp.]|nr:choice-of-anchor D domain-containing protein [Clostridium sp.]